MVGHVRELLWPGAQGRGGVGGACEVTVMARPGLRRKAGGERWEAMCPRTEGRGWVL